VRAFPVALSATHSRFKPFYRQFASIRINVQYRLVLATVRQTDYEQILRAVHAHVVERHRRTNGALGCCLPAETSTPAAAMKSLNQFDGGTGNSNGCPDLGRRSKHVRYVKLPTKYHSEIFPGRSSRRWASRDG
jgi:hypothetical protein